MLRIAAKKSAENGLKGVRQQTTKAAPQQPPQPPPAARGPPPKKSGGGGLKLAVGALTAGAVGVGGYAYVDPEFRHKVETAFPPAKQVFDKVLGDSSLNKTTQSIKDSVSSVIPKRKEEPILAPLPTPVLPPIEKAPPVHVDPVNVRKEIDVLPPKPSPELIADNNDQLEKTLVAALQKAEARVKAATEAKMETIRAVDEHRNLLKAAVDDMRNPNFDVVRDASDRYEKFSKKDMNAEADCRNHIDELRRIIDHGKANSVTARNPLLLNAAESANKFEHQLNELNNLVSKARTESSLANSYKNMVEQGRKTFEKDMKAFVPDIDTKIKSGSLTKDEIDALLVHAHLNVDSMRKANAELEVSMQKKIAEAVEEQKKADERIAAERFEVEVKRLDQIKGIDIERAIVEKAAAWETEIDERLKRANVAYSEHLQEVIRTQRQLFEIEQNQKVEEARHAERELHSRTVGQALSRLEGIEAALSSRVAQDAENRKSKQFWIACQSLIDTIVYGNKAGNDLEQRRLPLNDSLNVLQQVNPDDDFVKSLIDNFPEQAKSKGLYTQQDLENRFSKLYKLGRKTAIIDQNGGSLSSYMISTIRSFFLFDLPYKFSDEQKFDPVSISNDEILQRAKWHVDRKDFTNAIKMMQLLRGEPAQLAQDWVKDTRAHLESIFLAELLVAHAAVNSIRSTY